MINRRRFIQHLAAGCAAALPAAGKEAATIGLGLGNYGLKTYKPVDAIKFVAGVGYDSFELCLLPGGPTEPAALPAAARREIRAALAGQGMPLPSMLEAIAILGDHKANLERVRRGMQLGHDCNAGAGGVKLSMKRPAWN